MCAHTIIPCVLDAMEFAVGNEDESSERAVYFPTVLELAQEMLNVAIHALDDCTTGTET